MTARADQWERTSRARRCGAVECSRDGRVWLVRLGDRAAVVPHTVGMGYLAELIDHAGVEIAAVELSSGHAVSRPDHRPISRCSTPGPRPPIAGGSRSCSEEIDDADACADLDRAARARAELDQFVASWPGRPGFGGRGRCFADEAERARSRCARRSSGRWRSITEAEPVLGGRSARRVVTGTRCVLPGRRDRAQTLSTTESVCAPAERR